MAKVLEQIALKYLGLVTLKTRNCDGIDYHDVAVWKLAEALEAAYKAGYAKGQVSND